MRLGWHNGIFCALSLLCYLLVTEKGEIRYVYISFPSVESSLGAVSFYFPPICGFLLEGIANPSFSFPEFPSSCCLFSFGLFVPILLQISITPSTPNPTHPHANQPKQPPTHLHSSTTVEVEVWFLSPSSIAFLSLHHPPPPAKNETATSRLSSSSLLPSSLKPSQKEPNTCVGDGKCGPRTSCPAVSSTAPAPVPVGRDGVAVWRMRWLGLVCASWGNRVWRVTVFDEHGWVDLGVEMLEEGEGESRRESENESKSKSKSKGKGKTSGYVAKSPRRALKS